MEIKATAPCDRRQFKRERCCIVRFAREYGPVAVPAGPGHDADAAIVVTVTVGYQAEARRRAYFKQGQRLRQARQSRKQYRATCRLVGLRGPRKHDRAQFVRPLPNNLDEVIATPRDARDFASGGEKKIGLPSVFGQPSNELQNLNRGRYGESELLVGRRYPPRFDFGETLIAFGELAQSLARLNHRLFE